MKNLLLFHLVRSKLENGIEKVSNCLLLDDEKLWLVLGNKIQIYHSKTGKHSKEIVLEENILNVRYLASDNVVCVVTENHLIFILSDGNIIRSIDIQIGILCAEWSPMLQGTIALVNKDYFIRTVDIDCQNEYLEYTGESSFTSAAKDLFVNVGWGSAATQFRGTAGKLKLEDQQKDQEQAKLNDDSPKDFHITWNSEGKSFAVSYCIDDQHHFKVFSNSCKLLFNAEFVNGLKKQLSWRPEGIQWIAGHTITERECCIVLFENNGLFKDKFKLHTFLPVTKLEWSPCGQILAVLQWDETNKISYLNLWTSSNYHWYLKQSLQFDDRSELYYFGWLLNSQAKIKQLYCLTKTDFVVYNFKYIVNSTVCCEAEDRSCVAVIDGHFLKLTSFKQQMIAPPQSEVDRYFHSPINFVAFAKSGLKLFVVLADNTAICISLNYFPSGILELKQNRQIQLREYLPKSYLPLAISHFVWRCDRSVLFIVQNEEPTINSNDLYALDVNSEEDNLNMTLLTPVAQSLNLLLPDHNYGFVIQQENKTLSHLLDATENPFLDKSKQKQLERCFQISHITLDQEATEVVTVLSGNKFAVFSLTASDKLYCDEFLIESGVTSFIIHDNYLMFTDVKNDLYVIRLVDDFNYSDLKLEYSRRIAENSCRIITAVNHSSEIILQTPRGNLEVFSVRLLAINVVERHLQRNEWEQAYMLMRKIRLNFNLFVDLNAERFFSNLDLFVNGIKSTDGMCAFLMQLENINVFTTVYKNCSRKEIENIPNKKEAVAKALLMYFDMHNYTNFMIPVLTCCYLIDDIPRALRYIKSVMMAEKDERYSKVIATSSLKALQHLRLLVPPLTLYEKALSAYDLDMALFVAVNGNMDPMELVPLLNKLKNMDPIHMRFKVNDMLKNHERALYFLFKCLHIVPIQEVINYITKHRLHKSAIKFIQFMPNKCLTMKISALYGKYLMQVKKFDEAAYFFKQGNEYENALNCYKLCENWIEAIGVCRILKYDDKRFNDILYEIVLKLKQSGKHKNCAVIYESHLNDYEKAIDCYIQANDFNNALRLAYQKNRYDLIDTDIKPAIISNATYNIENLNKLSEDLKNHTARLEVIREEKIARSKVLKPEGMLSYDYDSDAGVQDYDDLYSESGTIRSRTSKASTHSRTSTKSGRSRRKNDLKKIDLRKGGKYEDIALMNALHKMIKKVYDLRQEINVLCNCVIQVNGFFGIATDLHKKLKSILVDINVKKHVIWPKKFDPFSEQENSIENRILTENFSLLDIELRHPPPETPVDWEIFTLAD